MDNEELDLPGPVADALRHVPAATRDTKDAHIAASLSAWEAESARPMTVTHLDSRRRALFSSAAACLLVVGGAIGWTLHSPGVGQVAADTSVRAATRPSTVAPLTSTTVAKGDATTATAGTPQCASGELQPIDSTYIGEFDAAGRPNRFAVRERASGLPAAPWQQLAARIGALADRERSITAITSP